MDSAIIFRSLCHKAKPSSNSCRHPPLDKAHAKFLQKKQGQEPLIPKPSSLASYFTIFHKTMLKAIAYLENVYRVSECLSPRNPSFLFSAGDSRL